VDRSSVQKFPLIQKFIFSYYLFSEIELFLDLTYFLVLSEKHGRKPDPSFPFLSDVQKSLLVFTNSGFHCSFGNAESCTGTRETRILIASIVTV